MPNGDVPHIFVSPDDESQHDSDVEFIEEVTPSKKPKHVHNLC